jgi:16S rRNA (adenine1518-N6/adenine1519-N6)-dimethyltransferase
VTLQLEVAHRLLAQRGFEDYGLLTVLVGLQYEVRNWFKIPAGCFFPEPEVDSACIVLCRRNEIHLTRSEQSTFIELVKAGFSQRRKMLLKLLKRNYEQGLLKRAFSEAGVLENARAESLDLSQFTRLAKLLHSYAGRDL